uniref:Uncharacterized protein n=1 Tax=Cepaea nemoralis TaxID=28835 RepID=A0A7S6WXI9_CEPNE|nr:hypothetical protein [Cepaea nemoralis]
MKVYLLNATLICLMSLTPGDSTVLAPAGGRTVEERACDELRRELAMLLRLVYDKKAWPNNFKKLLPHWVESHMPASCGKRRSYGKHISRPSMDAKGIYAMSSKIRHTREVVDGNFENEVHRLKRSILTADDDELKAILRGRRNTHRGHAANDKDGSAVLYRHKRFIVPGSSVPVPDFTSMSLGSANPGPGREISESAQMMSNLLMLTKLQKSRVAQEYRNIGRNSYIEDRVSFGSGMYGDSYPGKKKREVENYIAYNEAGMGPEALAEGKLRKKRFMFVTEPSEFPATPSLFSIFQGTALDPNTGKRLEFGGDVMKRAFGSTLMSFLPPGFQPPPGREPGDFIKSVAPLLLYNSASPGSAKKQNGNGLFGDTLPGKKKRKRSPDASYKDVFRFGDVPVDLFGIKGLARF